jgi:ferredoxin
MPRKAVEFISKLDLGGNDGAYYYAIATYGGFAANGLPQIKELLSSKHGIKLNYGRALKMFSNYVLMYDMKKNVEEITERSDKDLIPIIDDIKEGRDNVIKGQNPAIAWFHAGRIKKLSMAAGFYEVGEDCTGCAVCEEVCPVGNVEMSEARPRFGQACEQCMACIQYCPQRTINYKGVTRNRGRYVNPDVDYKELARLNGR